MAAIENIIAWAKQEQARLTQQLEELQSGRLRTYEKHAQAPGWLEIDTTEQSIELCRQYLSELSAIIALHPAIVPTARRAAALAAASTPLPRRLAPEPPAAAYPRRRARCTASQQAVHPDWVDRLGRRQGAAAALEIRRDLPDPCRGRRGRGQGRRGLLRALGQL